MTTGEPIPPVRCGGCGSWVWERGHSERPYAVCAVCGLRDHEDGGPPPAAGGSPVLIDLERPIGESEFVAAIRRARIEAGLEWSSADEQLVRERYPRMFELLWGQAA